MWVTVLRTGRLHTHVKQKYMRSSQLPEWEVAYIRLTFLPKAIINPGEGFKWLLEGTGE